MGELYVVTHPTRIPGLPSQGGGVEDVSTGLRKHTSSRALDSAEMAVRRAIARQFRL